MGLKAALGAGLFLAALPGFLPADDPFTDLTPLAIATRAVYGAAGWCRLGAILGLLDRSGSRSRGGGRGGATRTAGPARPTGPSGAPERWRRREYRYLAAAVLPLCVMHQPVAVAVAYGVVGWGVHMMVKYLAIVAASLALTVAACDLLVRRTRVTRFLFGVHGQIVA
ncbi:hypothetical protein [Streptomyces sp. NPDC002133]|uniref:hypothetical protein n=1 Tax=Streptomyces sp. NPDC002133 TaxID=3154409 RepID=UPI003320CB50